MTMTSKKLVELKNSKLQETYDELNINSKEEVLLLQETNEVDSMYRDLDLVSRKEHINNKLYSVNKLSVYDQKHNNEFLSFLGSHIKELCHTYFLKIRPISEVKRFLPEESLLDIKAYAQRMDVSISSNRFFILAPINYFKDNNKNKDCETYIIFYKDVKDSTNSNYHLVHEDDILTQVSSSGDDFADIRKIYHIFDNNIHQKQDAPSKRGALYIAGGIYLLGYILTIFDLLHVIAAFIFFAIATLVFGITLFSPCNSKYYWNDKL